MAKRHGHYCKICGAYKSNESFSGKGHNAHICKKCAVLPPEERSTEMTMTRMLNLPFHLSSDQMTWLKGLQHHIHPEIAKTAKEIYAMRFPYAERNERKKQLHIKHMVLTIQGELEDEYGDIFDAQFTFTLDRKLHSVTRFQGLDMDTVDLSGKKMQKLLNRIVNELEIFCWEDEDIDDSPEDAPPSWQAEVAYLNGEMQAMQGHDIPIQVNDLTLLLLQYFDEPNDDYDYD